MLTAKRILLIDDDEDDQHIFCKALESVYPHIQCDVANSGKEGIHLSLLHPYDLIFLDLNMPLMSGFDCLAALKKSPKTKNIMVIIISTSNRPEDIERSMKLGAATYFVKPSSFNQLLERLNSILTRGISYT